MTQLIDLWRRVAGGRGGLMFIGGEAGIGKSRLLTELLERVVAEGGRVMVGHTAINEPQPFQAVVEAIRSVDGARQVVDSSPNWRRPLAGLLPEIQDERERPPDSASVDASRERALLFEAIAQLLGQLANQQPTLLALEDAHWAGISTLELIEHLARRLVDAPIGIIVTYRDNEITASHPVAVSRGRLVAERLVTDLTLDRLPDHAVASLLEQLSAPELGPQLFLASEGNPLFLAELLRAHQEQQAVVAAAPGPTVLDELPPTIQATITSRLDRLTPDARGLAETAAVIGEAFSLDLVVELLRWSASRVESALGELLDRHLIRPTGPSRANDYTFTHHLVQTTIYDAIPTIARQRRHRRLAQLIEDLYPERLDDFAATLAHHYAAGDEPTTALPWFKLAAERALAHFANRETVDLIVQALSLTPGARDTVELLLLQETASRRLGDRAAQRRALTRLQVLADALHDPELVCEILARQIRLYDETSDRLAHAAAVAALQTHAPATNQVIWRARAHQASGWYQRILCHYDAARADTEQALALYHEAGEHTAIGDCYSTIVFCAIAQRDRGLAYTCAEALIQLGESSADLDLLGRALRTSTIVADQFHDIPLHRQRADRYLEVARESGDRFHEANALIAVAYAEFNRGALALAYQRCLSGATLHQQLNSQRSYSNALTNQAKFLVHVGHHTEAVKVSETAVEIAEAIQDTIQMGYALLWLAVADLNAGNLARAQPAAERALAISQEAAFAAGEIVDSAVTLSVIAARQGRWGDALAHAELATRVAQESTAGGDIVNALANQARVAVGANDLALARQSLDALIAAFPDAREKTPVPQQVAWAVALVAHRLGDSALAASWLAEAAARLRERVEMVGQADWATSFAAIPDHVAIVAAHARGVWPSTPV